MNLAIALTAAREGASVANHVEVVSLIKESVRMYLLQKMYKLCELRVWVQLCNDPPIFTAIELHNTDGHNMVLIYPA